MYDADFSVRAIARATGIPAKTVHRRLGQAGTVFRSPGGQAGTAAERLPLSAADTEAMAAAYRAGDVSLDDLGRTYERSADCIARLLRDAGVGIRPRGRTLAAGTSPAIPADVTSLHRQGLRPADIAALTPGASAQTIARELRRAGLTPHRGRPIPAGEDLACAYADAGSLRALAAVLHADEERLRGALAEAGVPAGSLRKVPVELRPEAARLAAAGTPPRQISELTGLPAEATARLGRPARADGGTAQAA
jgi:hypothetical protein